MPVRFRLLDSDGGMTLRHASTTRCPASARVLLLLLCVLFCSNVAARVSELQRVLDQAGESPQVTVVAPDGNHFYVFGSRDILGYAVFPAGAPSPRVLLVRGQIDGVAVPNATRAVFSPDSRHLYVTQRSDQVMILSRDLSTGGLSLVGTQTLPSTPLNGSDGAISPDGLHFYAAGRGSVHHYARNTTSGDLSFVASYANDIVNSNAGRLLITADGTELFVRLGDVLVMDRNLQSGALVQKQVLAAGNVAPMPPMAITVDDRVLVAGDASRLLTWHRADRSAPFILGSTLEANTTTLGSFGQAALIGSDLYLPARFDAVVGRFTVGNDGSLTELEVAATARTLSAMSVFAGGTRLLAASNSTDEWVLVDRDPETGALSLAPEQIYSGAPDGTQGLAISALALSPDESTLVTRSISDSMLFIFDVLSDGRVVARQSETELLFEADKQSIAFVSNDRFYTTSLGLTIDAWDRDPNSGTWVRRQATPYGLGFDGRLIEPAGLLLSLDGRFLYGTGFDYNGGHPVMVFEIEANGDLTPLQTLDLPILGGNYSVLEASDEQEFLYAFGRASQFSVIRRDAASGLLTFVETHPERVNGRSAVGLPGQRVLAPGLGSPGLHLLQHQPDGSLVELARFEESEDGPFRGIGRFQLEMFRIPDTRRFMSFHSGTPATFALFELDPMDRLVYVDRFDAPGLAGTYAMVATADGRRLYSASLSLGGLVVSRVDSLSKHGFEAPILELVEPVALPD